MLNQKMEDRKNQHNVSTQTIQRHSTISAQTDQQEDVFNKYLSMGYGGEYEESSDSDAESQVPTTNRNLLNSSQVGQTKRIVGNSYSPTKTIGITGNAGSVSNRLLIHESISAGASSSRTQKAPRGLSRKKLYIYNIGD